MNLHFSVFGKANHKSTLKGSVSLKETVCFTRQAATCQNYNRRDEIGRPKILQLQRTLEKSKSRGSNSIESSQVAWDENLLSCNPDTLLLFWSLNLHVSKHELNNIH